MMPGRRTSDDLGAMLAALGSLAFILLIAWAVVSLAAAATWWLLQSAFRMLGAA